MSGVQGYYEAETSLGRGIEMSMSPLPEPFVAEAKALLGDSWVITDAANMQSYITSMRHRYVRESPMVALPRTTEQVSGLVKLCQKYRIACVPQGGNTGLVDGGLPNPDGDEIIINMSRMNKIRDIDTIGLIATVESGVILQQLHEAVETHGLMFPLWIASEGSAEVGGLISANAGGLSALRYGSMRQQVLGVEAVMPNGEVVSGLRALVKDNTGYHLASYFIGAEGTLGIVTAATLRLYPLLRQKVTAVVAIADIQSALQLLGVFQRSASEHLSAFEFMSLASLQIYMKNIQGARFPSNKTDAPYYLLIELSSSSDIVPLRDLFESIVSEALDQGKALDAVIAENETQTNQFWDARENIPDALRVEKQRLHFDISLPIKSLADFLLATETLIKSAFPGVTLMPFGHIGDGNVHYNMYFHQPLDAEMFVAAKKRIQEIVFGEVESWQGSISAEHGVGVERKDILAAIKSPVELNTMRAIKRALDPQNLMNPGKIFD